MGAEAAEAMIAGGSGRGADRTGAAEGRQKGGRPRFGRAMAAGAGSAAAFET